MVQRLAQAVGQQAACSIALAAECWALLPPVRQAVAILRSGFNQTLISTAIDGMLKPLGLVLVLLALLG